MNLKNLKRRPGGVVGFVIFLVVVTIFASGAIAVYTIFMNPENKSAVPQLVGSSTVSAVSEAEKLGLIVQLEPVASTMPEGRVLAQSPEAGSTLRKGQVILLQISQGGELHPIPDVKGKTLTQAQEEIKAQGFILGDVIRISEPNAKAGTVIAQSPAAPANVSSGQKIDLLVQVGNAQPESISIPDVNRMTEDEARNVLETAGVKIQGVERVYSPMVPEGLAIETRPGVGTLIRPGQGVILKLATQRRPSGYETQTANSQNSASKGNGTVTTPRNIPGVNQNQAQNQTSQPATTAQNQNNNRGVTVSVGGEEEVFIGDDYDLSTQTTTAQNNQNQTRTPAATQQNSSPAPTPATTSQQTPASSSNSQSSSQPEQKASNSNSNSS
ncbi:MAG: PASTA domain-containing protein, partial [Synergistaceae bacterium]|nr:PASTA domain-containing protein [Synergistaceae bacterium]